MSDYSTEDNVTNLALALAETRQRKEKLAKELVELETKEKDIAFKINTAMGIIPVREAAARVQKMIDKGKEWSKKRRSDIMKTTWARKSPEQRAIWKQRIQESRRAHKADTTPKPNAI